MFKRKEKFGKVGSIGSIGIRRAESNLFVGGLSRATAEFFVKIVAASDHKNQQIAAHDFINDSVVSAGGAESVNKKPAERAMERLAGAKIVVNIRKTFSNLLLRLARKPHKVLFGGRGEEYFRHNLTFCENLPKSSELAGSQRFSRRAGPLPDFFNYRGMPENILAQNPPYFLDFQFNFLDPAFGCRSY